MKWFKKKGVLFSVSVEVTLGLIGLVAGIAALAGFLAYAIIGAAAIVMIAIFAAGGDISI